MFIYTHCPACAGQEFKPHLSCKDYTVSQEIFQIVSCTRCSLKFTNPIPDLSRLGDYYKSEDYISHSDTKKGLISTLYHLVRTQALKSKLRLVENHVSRGTILDFGAGTGAFLDYAKSRDWKTIGMEPDQGARQLAASKGLAMYKDLADLERNLEGKVDAISLWHVLEHVVELKQALAFFRKALKPGAVLFIAVPNHKSFDAELYKEFWAAYDVPRHLYHFEQKTLTNLVTPFGFELKETRPMKFDSFYVSMLSEKYKHGSIRYPNAFINGLRSNLRARGNGEYSSLIYVFRAS